MIKLISLNIQGDMHHEKNQVFFKRENPDVICVQEIYREDLEKYEKVLGMKSFFKPSYFQQSYFKKEAFDKIIGSAIFTNHNVKFNHQYILGDEYSLPIQNYKPTLEKRGLSNVVLIWAEIFTPQKDVYKIATIHFTLTPEGISTEYQIEDTKKLIKILTENLENNFVLVGDLNAPRGNKCFAMLAEKFKDNVPLEYDSSIDPKLHKVFGLRLMVDGLFSTNEYVVSDFKFIEGVSDHKAIIANICNLK